MRLIIDPPTLGAKNMSLDEALLHSVAAGTSPPTLRFYQWSEPTLSLGYFQKLEDRQQHTSSLACPIVRRSSGGGAILHDQELTYSIAMQVDDRFGSRELYTQVHEALIEVLAGRSMVAELFSGEPPAECRQAFLCFQRRTPGDVVLRGAKVCGSAQRRVGTAVLQHGSLILSQSRAAPELPGLRELGGDRLSETREIIGAWITALHQRLELGSLDQGEWTSLESEEANRWERVRYGEIVWLARR
jgi:lipoate-protein ligase A